MTEKIQFSLVNYTWMTASDIDFRKFRTNLTDRLFSPHKKNIFHFKVIEIIEENKSIWYIYCSHCNNVVTRSTFKGTKKKRYSASSMRKTPVELSTETPYSSDSDSTMDDKGKLLMGSWMLLNICDWGSQVIFDNKNIGFSTYT